MKPREGHKGRSWWRAFAPGASRCGALGGREDGDTSDREQSEEDAAPREARSRRARSRCHVSREPSEPQDSEEEEDKDASEQEASEVPAPRAERRRRIASQGASHRGLLPQCTGHEPGPRPRGGPGRQPPRGAHRPRRCSGRPPGHAGEEQEMRTETAITLLSWFPLSSSSYPPPPSRPVS